MPNPSKLSSKRFDLSIKRLSPGIGTAVVKAIHNGFVVVLMERATVLKALKSA